MTSDSILAKKNAVDDNKKYILLSNRWKPDRDYQLPFQRTTKTIKLKKGKDGDLVTHEQHNVNKEAVQRGHDFMRAYLNPSLDVNSN
ncbi:hypothetical protein BgiBS90_004722 [Biomphalaria glabrata]|nr:hypothetical protein BgiBS90_004722 [Biomphalaria glabrata]